MALTLSSNEDPAEQAPAIQTEPVRTSEATQAIGLLPPTHWTELAEQVGVRKSRALGEKLCR